MTFDIGDGIDSAVNYILDNFSPALDTIAAIIGFVTGSIQSALVAIPSSPASRFSWSITWACGAR